AQTALVKLFERVDRYDPRRGPALPWILGIAAWEARTVRQRRGRPRGGVVEGGGRGREAGPPPPPGRRALRPARPAGRRAAAGARQDRRPGRGALDVPQAPPAHARAPARAGRE